MKRAPVEPKVSAGSLGATAAGIIVWVLQAYVLKNHVSPGLAAYVYAAVPGIVAFLVAWLAPHQARPGDVIPPPPSNVTVMPPVPPAAP